MAIPTYTASRRQLLTAAVALASPVAAVPALAAVSTGPHPDAALLALGREYDAVWAKVLAGMAVDAAADDRYRALRPSVPEALFARPEDRDFNFPKPNGTPMGTREEGPDFYSHWVPEELRYRLAQEGWRLHWSERTARAEAIVAAWDAFKAADDAALAAAGVDRATDDEIDALYDPLWDIQDEIACTPAHTLAGVVVKARVAVDEARREHGRHYRLADPKTVMDDLRSSNGTTSEAALGMAVVFDLLRLAPAAA